MPVSLSLGRTPPTLTVGPEMNWRVCGPSAATLLSALAQQAPISQTSRGLEAALAATETVKAYGQSPSIEVIIDDQFEEPFDP